MSTNKSLEQRVRDLENAGVHYGPIIIGGPCRLCGRPSHGGTCESAELAEKATIKRLTDFIRRSIKPKETAMTTMRAKMRVNSVTKYGDPVNQVNLTFAAVGKSTGYNPDGADEDNTYAKHTPSAAIQITIQNPALLDTFEEGQKYYVDFTSVPV
jgi:hypothetical protein